MSVGIERPNKQDFQRRLQKIESLVRTIESSADPNVRSSAVELMQSLMDLHGAGFERMMEIVFDSGPDGGRIIDRFAEDELLESLLLLYGLHPDDLETRVVRALDKVRPYLQSHGGNVELLGIADGLVKLRLHGSCNGCASSAMTLKLAIEEAIYEVAPDVTGLEVEGVINQATTPGLVQLQKSSNGNGSSKASVNGGLKHIAEMPTSAKRPQIEQCEMCKVVLAENHQHLIELENRKLVCVCEACAILFSNQSEQKYRRVPRRIHYLPEFRLNDAQWESLLIPINMAFFFHSTGANKVVAFYPSPAGATESLLEFESWEEIVAENPILKNMESDVEALLVNRVDSARKTISAEHYIVPIDECYKLVGIIRAGWRGLSGGSEVWEEIASFFAGLKQRSVATKEVARA